MAEEGDKCFAFFRQARIGYPTQTAVLTIEFLSIADGTRLAILGRSGAGKTTLINAILRRGVDVAGTLELPRLEPGTVGLVGQAQSLFPWKTARDHILWACEGSQHARDPEEVLAEVGLGGHGNKFPDQLSGGMRRRLMLGMAMIVGTRLLILDEAFSGVDSVTKAELVGTVHDHCQRNGTTLLMISHDMAEISALADRFVVVDRAGGLSEIDVVNPCYGAPLFASVVSEQARMLYDELRILTGDQK